MLSTLYWTWYWNPGSVTLGFFAIALPTAALFAFIAMLWDFCTRGKKQKVDITHINK